MDPNMVGQLWTQSFLRLVSHSSDEKKLRAIQQIILHNHGSKETNSGYQIETQPAKKSPRKVVKVTIHFPKKPLADIDSIKSDEFADDTYVVKKSPKTNQETNFKTDNSRTVQENKRLPPLAPLMGKWAPLLSKCNNYLEDSSIDGEIVTKLVMEKFRNMLNYYHGRSFMRKKANKNIAEDANFDHVNANTQLDSDHNSSNTKVDLLSSAENVHSSAIDQSMDTIWEVEELPLEDKENVEATQIENNEIETLDNESLAASFEDEFLELDLAVSTGSALSIRDETSDKDSFVEENSLYDADKFLEEALGDELHHAYSLDSNIDNADRVLFTRASDEYNNSSSVNSSQISSLYRANAILPNSKSEILIQEAAAQKQIILQTCKALTYCEASKQFASRMEYVECEKLLQLANLKYEAIKKEMRRSTYEGLSDLGQVTISNLAFPVVEKKNPSDELTLWCFATISCGGTVQATETVKVRDSNIQFKKSFKFENLDVDFEIAINLYALYVKNNTKNGKQYRTKQNTIYPTIKKLMKFKSNKNSKSTSCYERRQPAFLLWGTYLFHISDLKQEDTFKLVRVPSNSILKGTMTADITSSTAIVGTHSGFLTIGSEAGGCAAWNRRWCQLNGYIFKYWNYPTEEDVVEPIQTLDLRYCVGSRIDQVNRELCPRQRTLLLEIAHTSTNQDHHSLMVSFKSVYTITKHYLSADNYQDMTKWQHLLNSVVSKLRNWNYMKCQLYFTK